MNQQSLAVALLVFIIFVMSGIVIHDIISKNRLNFNEQKSNWEWSDDWNNIQPEIPEQPVTPEQPIVPVPEDPQRPQGQVIASNFQDALTKAKEYNMPILVLFEADWCSWCKKMKNETLTDAKVKEVMMHYVYVSVNTDQNKDVAKTFNVGSLPTCLITNANQEIIAQEPGYKSAIEFFTWLNRSDLFDLEPESKPQVPPEIQQKPQPQIQPPTPQQPQSG